MASPRHLNWTQLRAEIRRRWFILTLAGIYLLVGGLFATLIYGFGWDQSATRWAALIYPLPAARVNGQIIWLSDYYRRLKIYEHYDRRVQAEQPDLLPEDPYQRKQKVLDELVQITLLSQQAKKAGIKLTQAQIDDTFKKLVDNNGGADNFKKVLADFYGVTPQQFEREFVPEELYREKIQDQLFTQIHVRHIVLKDAASAQQVLDRVKKGEDFAGLAKNFSQDLSSRDQGGDLGWVRRGQLVKPFEDAAFALPAGQFTQNLVQTQFGFHIIKVDERKDGPVGDKSFADWFSSLASPAKVKRYVPKAPKNSHPASTSTSPTASATPSPTASPAPS